MARQYAHFPIFVKRYFLVSGKKYFWASTDNPDQLEFTHEIDF